MITGEAQEVLPYHTRLDFETKKIKIDRPGDGLAIIATHRT
jgi:hypothetical protein